MNFNDFTVKMYKNICEVLLNSSFTFKTIDEALESFMDKDKVSIMRHDVDANPMNALRIANVEHQLGIKSTYYFRFKKGVFIPNIIEQISNLGHEIGYHYEVLYDSRGNIKQALKLFESQLNEFRKYTNVKTISMHGSPLSKWNELDLWKDNNFKDYNVNGEAFTSLDFDKIYYFTDTGRAWNNSRFNVRDRVSSKLNHPLVNDSNDLINVIKRINSPLCINTHPQRWTDNPFAWYKELINQAVKNQGKKFLRFIGRR